MSSKYIQEGRVLDHTPGSALAVNDVIVIGDRVAVALNAIAAGATGPVAVEGVFELTKLGTDTIDQGQVVYWDAGNSRITETASTHKVAGFAVEAAGSGVTTCKVKLNA